MNDADDTAGRRSVSRLLELGLSAVLILAPLPFGAVTRTGRLALELAALLLLAAWMIRAVRHSVTLPPRRAVLGLAGLLGLGLLQALPLGATAVGLVSPRSLEIRQASRPTDAALAAEQRLLDSDPRDLDATPALSVDPRATASAVRTGLAMAAFLLVATTVAADRGLAGLALALLVSAGLQGFYGLLVLTSEDPHIWQSPKLHYLESATGTFVNRNHFACFLAMGLASGLALLLRNARRVRASGGRNLLLQTLSGDHGRNLLLGLLFVVGLAGLLASLSRAGIFLGLGGLALTLLVAGKPRGVRTRLVVACLTLLAAALPLLQLGAERLADRYARSTTDLFAAGGRAVVWGDTLAMTAAFPLVGSGFGTFGAAYPLFRSPEVRLFYSHAHNDLLQLGSEAGILGLLSLALLLGPVAASMARGLSGRAGSVAVGLAAGLLVALLHSLVDFNFHIPANGATAAILAGGLLGVTCANRASS